MGARNRLFANKLVSSRAALRLEGVGRRIGEVGGRALQVRDY